MLGPRGRIERASAHGATSPPWSTRSRISSPSGGAAGLAREDDLDALGLEPGTEQARLGGLAGAVEPLEGDEHLRVEYGDAGARHRRCRIHRLARGRGARRARRRGTRRRRSLEGQARAGARCSDPPRPRHQGAARRTSSARAEPRRSCISPRRPTCASRSGPRARCRGQRARHRQRARGRPAHVDARVVFASTGGAIYGECERPARESDPCLPLSPYGAAKLAGEGYLGAFARLYGAPHVALRFGNVYGPRRIRMARRAWWRSSSGGCATEQPAGSSATARRAATTCTSRTSPARPGGARRGRRVACSTSAPAPQRRCSSSTRSAGRPRHGCRARPRSRAAGRARAQRARRRARRDHARLPPRDALASGIATTWESIRSAP